jgi:hypothetical protein
MKITSAIMKYKLEPIFIFSLLKDALVIIRRTAAKTQQHPFPDDTTALHWPLN